MNYEGAIAEFGEYLQQVGYKPATARMLPLCVQRFALWGGAAALGSPTAADILAFYTWLRECPQRCGGYSAMYIHHHIYALRVYYRWRERCGRLGHNPLSVLKFPRPQCPRRAPLARSEVGALFAACEHERERALLHLFYSCGLRRSEGAALKVGEVHCGARVLYVRSGKGGRRRAVPLAPSVASALARYLHGERSGAAPGDAFMLNRRGAPMNGENYHKAFKALAARAGLQAVSLHHLRHSIATHLLAGGLSVEQVRDFLGHRHLESTQVYAQVREPSIRRL